MERVEMVQGASTQAGEAARLSLSSGSAVCPTLPLQHAPSAPSAPDYLVVEVEGHGHGGRGLLAARRGRSSTGGDGGAARRGARPAGGAAVLRAGHGDACGQHGCVYGRRGCWGDRVV